MERLAMHRVREILRLRWVLKLGVRQAASAAGVGRSVVSKTSNRAERAGLSWETVEAMTDAELEAKLYGVPQPSAASTRAEPDPIYIHTELRRPGVTLELLHLEYLQAHPDCYRYTAYCDRYRAWQKKRGVRMRQAHRAGEKSFVDYSGKRPYLIDPLGQTACRRGLRVCFRRVSRLFDELALAKADGTYTKVLHKLARAQLLILDDLGLGVPTDAQRHDLLEVLEDRYGTRSTVVTSQLPRENWHDWIGEPTIADAVLDRLVHNAYKIDLQGPSRRRNKS